MTPAKIFQEFVRATAYYPRMKRGWPAFTRNLHSFRSNRFLRLIIVSMTLLGWFVISNHCALGSATKPAEAKREHACCQNGTSDPAKGPTDAGQGMPCCKSLHALMPDVAKLGEMPTDFVLDPVPAWVASLYLQIEAILLVTVATGPPPRVASFNDLVLHRSLRSHAPPLLA